MKIRLVFLSAAVAASAFIMQGCLKDQADIFDKTSSARTSDMISEVKAILVDAENGWSMTYYPGATARTSTYVLSFTTGEVTATNEVDTTLTVKSLYKIDDNDGPVLSFDSYNEVLHRWATPSSSAYQAQGGDFEFKIMDVTPDRIVLKGRRGGSTGVLERLKETPSQFFKGILDMGNKFSYAAFSCTITNGAVEGFLDAGSRTLSIGRKGADDNELTKVRYVITETGLHLHNPIEVNGVVLEDFEYNPDTDVLTASGITMNKVIPEGWISYSRLLGKYTLKFSGGSFPVALEQDEVGSSFFLTGLSPAWKLPVRYNSGRGRLGFKVQSIGSSDTHQYWFCALDGGAQSFSWSTDAGMITTVDDENREDFTLSFIDDGEYDGLVWVSFYVTAFSGSPSSSTYDSRALPSDWNFANGAPYLVGPISMTKNND